jgi:hypothetical protein
MAVTQQQVLEYRKQQEKTGGRKAADALSEYFASKETKQAEESPTEKKSFFGRIGDTEELVRLLVVLVMF